MSRAGGWRRQTILAGLVLIGVWTRVPGLFHNTFQADEALFATWARLIATWRDPLLRAALPDKPPFLFYVQALVYPLVGPVDWAARLPNWAASLLAIPLTAQWAWRLYRERLTALLAAGLMTLSPLAIQFAPTAFLDPWLMLWLLAALAWQGRGGRHAAWSGLAFGLAAATKYQAWLFLPLALALGWLQLWDRRAWGRWLIGLAGPVALALWWGGLGLAARQWAGYGGIRPIFSWELWPRLAAWGDELLTLVGSPLVGLALILGLPLFLALLLHDLDRPTALDQMFILFVGLYLAGHWFTSAAVTARYWLPLLPVLAVLFGRFAARLLTFMRLPPTPALHALLLVAYVAAMAPVAWRARAGAYPVGGSPQADSGAAQVAAFLADAPYGTVLYDHWFSWHWRYYFLEQRVFVSWFPHPAALVEDLRVFADERRFIVLPNDDRSLPVRRALIDGGYTLTPVFHTTVEPGLTLYQVRRGLAWNLSEAYGNRVADSADSIHLQPSSSL